MGRVVRMVLYVTLWLLLLVGAAYAAGRLHRQLPPPAKGECIHLHRHTKWTWRMLTRGHPPGWRWADVVCARYGESWWAWGFYSYYPEPMSWWRRPGPGL